jgi:hypothetical protein
MIVLDFKFKNHFWTAAQFLEEAELRFKTQPALGDMFPNRIFFFEEELRNDCQRMALKEARREESRDFLDRRRFNSPSLAIPV